MDILKENEPKRKKMIELQNSLIKADSITTCTNCEFWSQPNQLCEKYKMLPPAEVIVTGCVQWMYTIPF